MGSRHGNVIGENGDNGRDGRLEKGRQSGLRFGKSDNKTVGAAIKQFLHVLLGKAVEILNDVDIPSLPCTDIAQNAGKGISSRDDGGTDGNGYMMRI